MTTLYSLSWDPAEVVAVDPETGAFEVVTKGAGAHPDGIAVVDQRIFWTTMGPGTPADNPEGADYTAADGALYTVTRTGEDFRELIPQGSTTTGKQLVHDGLGNLIWGNREGFAVSTCRLDGSGLRDLVKRDGSGNERDWCVGVAVDPANGKLYWTQKGATGANEGRIFRAGLEIPEGETAENRSDIELLWDHLPAPIDLEILDGYLYWTDRSLNSLQRGAVPEDGGRPGEPEVLGSGFEQPIALALDPTHHVAFVSDLGGRIWGVPSPEAGGEKTVLVDPGFPLTGLVLSKD